MQKGKLIAGLALGLVVVFTLTSFAAYRVVKWASGESAPATELAQGTPATGAPSNKAVTSYPDAPLPIIVEDEAMAQAFRSGKLPAPLSQPQGVPELTAMELAKRVVAKDDQSTAALLTAMQMSGFSVRADDGTLAYESVKPGQGIWIDAWEVAALAKLFGEEMHVKLSDLSDAFAIAMPSLKNAPVAKLFVDGLRGASQGNQPAMRFWADFIAELGRQSEQPYDLLAPDVDPTKVDLDAIQVSLILRRLVADFMIQERSKQKGQWRPLREEDWAGSKWERASYDFAQETQPYLRDAVWHPELGPRFLLVQEGGGSNLPCTLTEFANQLMDVFAYSSGKVFDRLLEAVESEAAEKYGKATAKANAVLALIKLIAYYACLETDISMSGNPPLKRTQSTSIFKRGEQRTLTGTVRENTKNWQAVNCTRIALNGANLDISLPSDGPVKDVRTDWKLETGGVSGKNGAYTVPFVAFVSPDTGNRIQTAMAPTYNTTSPKTDEKGETKIDIEGLQQPEELIKPVPVMKQAEVDFTVAPKAVTMSQDLIDAAGVGLKIPGKDGSPIASPLNFAIGGMVETLLRANLHLSKTLTIPVQDWISCEGGWGGTVSYTTVNHIDQIVGGTDNHQANTIDETLSDSIILRGDPKVGSGWNSTPHGTFDASYELRVVGVTVYPPVKLFRGAVVTTEDTNKAGGAGEAKVELHSLGDNKFDIQIIGGTIEGTHHWHTSCMGECKGKPQPDMNNPIQYSALGISATAKEDPNNPGVLHGSETRPDTPSPGVTTTINWNLTQCQGGK